MLAWLSANAATILISAALLVIVVLIVRGMIAKRITGCGGDCASCGSACAAPVRPAACAPEGCASCAMDCPGRKGGGAA